MKEAWYRALTQHRERLIGLNSGNVEMKEAWYRALTHFVIFNNTSIKGM